MQRHLFAFSICSPPAATAAEGVASMWVCIAACVCVAWVCACCFECICIPYTFNYYLPCTRCNSSSSSGSRNASTTNKQTAHTKILTKYATHTHTHTNANPPPTWCFLLDICIKDFYARCKQCEEGLEEMGNCEMRCQPMPDLVGPMHANYLRLHNSAQGTESGRKTERESKRARERHESTLCYAATTARATWLG